MPLKRALAFFWVKIWHNQELTYLRTSNFLLIPTFKSLRLSPSDFFLSLVSFLQQTPQPFLVTRCGLGEVCYLQVLCNPSIKFVSL